MSVFGQTGQLVPNNPFQLYWHRYVLEFNDSTIIKNKVKSVTAKIVDYKKDKIWKERILYKAEFDPNGLPESYHYQLEFSLRNDYRYNPFWRMINEYPVFTMWHYQLKYDSLHRLSQITETEKHTNSKYEFIEEVVFEYDSLGKVKSQTIQKRNGAFPQFPFNRNKYLRIKINDSLMKVIHFNDDVPVDTAIVQQNRAIELTTFWFGDTSESFIRNAPYDKNGTLYEAIDKNSQINRNSKGLKTKKQQKLVINEYTTVKSINCIIYEYEFY